MRKLYDTETDKFIGTVSDEEFQFLVDQLEEESPDDTDYYVNRETLDLLTQAGVSAHLLVVLQHALGEREEMEVRWAPDENS